MEVSNIRSLQQKPSLHVNGFEACPCGLLCCKQADRLQQAHKLQVVPFTVPEGIDWTDKKQVRTELCCTARVLRHLTPFLLQG